MSPTTPSEPPQSSKPVRWDQAQRQTHFDAWFVPLCASHQLAPGSLRLASADASFRRYLRVDGLPGGPWSSLIIMDAPPEQIGSKPFVQVADLMAKAGLTVPQVLAWDETHGFLLLSDLGPQTMLQALQTLPTQATRPPLGLFLDAVETLVQWQLASHEGVLPPYDQAFVMRELELFPQWYIAEHRKFTLDAAQRKTLDTAFAAIARSNLAWPNVYMHRDFMPRNLMMPVYRAPTLSAGASSLPPEGADTPWGGPAAHRAPTLDAGKPSATRLGVLDFQDAVYGPITYDMTSRMRDAFISWEEDFCLDVTIRYWEKARKANLPVGDDFGEFYKGVEWMGLQRHLKIAGIFARLSLRDGKPQYLADTPRFIAYIRATCARYMELKPLLRLVEKIEGIEVPNVFAFGRS